MEKDPTTARNPARKQAGRKTFSHIYQQAQQNLAPRRIWRPSRFFGLLGRRFRWVLLGISGLLLLAGFMSPFLFNIFQPSLPVSFLELEKGAQQGVANVRLAGSDKEGNRYQVFADQISVARGAFSLTNPSFTIARLDDTWLQAHSEKGFYRPLESVVSLDQKAVVSYSRTHARISAAYMEFHLDRKELRTDAPVSFTADFMEAQAQKGLQASLETITLFGPLSVVLYGPAAAGDGRRFFEAVRP